MDLALGSTPFRFSSLRIEIPHGGIPPVRPYVDRDPILPLVSDDYPSQPPPFRRDARELPLEPPGWRWPSERVPVTARYLPARRRPNRLGLPGSGTTVAAEPRWERCRSRWNSGVWHRPPQGRLDPIVRIGDDTNGIAGLPGCFSLETCFALGYRESEGGIQCSPTSAFSSAYALIIWIPNAANSSEGRTTRQRGLLREFAVIRASLKSRLRK